jgi:hypothetical protein
MPRPGDLWIMGWHIMADILGRPGLVLERADPRLELCFVVSTHNARAGFVHR